MKRRSFWTTWLLLGIVATILAGCGQRTAQRDNQANRADLSHYAASISSSKGNHDTSLSSQSPLVNTPDETLARSVLTPTITKQLGADIRYNGHGAFIINHNQTGLVAKVGPAPYANNQVDTYRRPTVANALLNKTTRQYRNRQQTGNGATMWRPAGFKQVTNLPGKYHHAYDRGHLLGYALVGNLRHFDASEANAKNIATQTAWANEARQSDSTGQNYYEGLVRKALDQGKTVRYRVTNLYEGSSLVPSGAHLEAKAADGSLQFNVFVPNVQPGLTINYQTGAVTIK
ncbi:DNA/RNA non-specific endonuclease [Limosilactobacillus reuteri]|uniref:DNA/RNA non-specific endonuclease n=1 Tax=Limosilactobacillus reuteri TaxID=1598 RepID=UPI001E4E17E4|nr:DNA/RNA non-specific endonuclease [Limosilactobacillus reuteri]MCC4500323.1 DNA/RNA non-specific endonuclease [Limosilactobacillus reuteri]MCC4500648.1 DNA/RNA non-specific endonuclease [Limosilactobacillus reuteri]